MTSVLLPCSELGLNVASRAHNLAICIFTASPNPSLSQKLTFLFGAIHAPSFQNIAHSHCFGKPPVNSPFYQTDPKVIHQYFYSGFEGYGSSHKFNGSWNALAEYWELVSDVLINSLSLRLKQTWRPALPLTISWLWPLTENVPHVSLQKKGRFPAFKTVTDFTQC